MVINSNVRSWFGVVCSILETVFLLPRCHILQFLYIFGCIYDSVLIFVLDRRRVRLRSKFVLLQQSAFLWVNAKKISPVIQGSCLLTTKLTVKCNESSRAHVSKVIDHLMLLIEHMKLSLLTLHWWNTNSGDISDQPTMTQEQQSLHWWNLIFWKDESNNNQTICPRRRDVYDLRWR